jgi:hypothetical protein
MDDVNGNGNNDVNDNDDDDGFDNDDNDGDDDAYSPRVVSGVVVSESKLDLDDGGTFHFGG